MRGLSFWDAVLKRTLDIVVAVMGLVVFGWLVVLAALATAIDTGRSGFFTQTRVGRHGRHFSVIKLRTMRDMPDIATMVTTDDDVRITRLGRVLRKLKIDELPQLVNVLVGHMSLVGPRPDIPGFADQLKGESRIILSVRPGITGPATLKYRHEEYLLAGQDDPEAYNRDIIYPDKVRINVDYVRNWSFFGDIGYLIRTVSEAVGGLRRDDT